MVRPLEDIQQPDGTPIFMAPTATPIILATTATILSTPPCLATGTITKLARRGAVMTRSQLARRCTLFPLCEIWNFARCHGAERCPLLAQSGHERIPGSISRPGFIGTNFRRERFGADWGCAHGPNQVRSRTMAKQPSIVFAHGLWADGS